MIYISNKTYKKVFINFTKIAKSIFLTFNIVKIYKKYPCLDFLLIILLRQFIEDRFKGICSPYAQILTKASVFHLLKSLKLGF